MQTEVVDAEQEVLEVGGAKEDEHRVASNRLAQFLKAARAKLSSAFQPLLHDNRYLPMSYGLNSFLVACILFGLITEWSLPKATSTSASLCLGSDCLASAHRMDNGQQRHTLSGLGWF